LTRCRFAGCRKRPLTRRHSREWRETDRLDWIDAAKGIGIILVVIGHAIDGLMTSDHLSASSGAATLHFFVYTFHMPLFFLLAGVAAAGSLERTGPARFMAARFVSLAHPYVVWSLIQGGVQLSFAGQLNHGISGWDLIAIAWQPIGHFWFLYALMLCHLFYGLGERFGDKLLLAIPFAFALSWIVPNGLLATTLYNLPYYLAGLALAPALMTSRPLAGVSRTRAWQFSRTRAWQGVAILAVLFLIAAGLARGTDDPRGFYGIAAIPAAVLGIGLVMATSCLVRGGILKTLVELGRSSLAIYLMHIMAVAGSRILLTRSGLISDGMALLVITTVVGVMAPLLALNVLERLRIASALGIGAGRGRSVAVQGRAGH